MNIVILERSSVGFDVDVSCFDRLGNVTSYDNSTAEEAKQRVKDADIIIANKTPLNAATLAEASHVKLIEEFATGYDNIDLEYCKAHGIAVANVRGYSTDAVVQHTFAMALYLLEHLPHYDAYVKSGEYSRQDRFTYYGKTFTELAGSVWGIAGMGSIGSKVAKIARTFGAKVIHYSTSGTAKASGDPDVKEVDLDTLLKESDILSLHCPLTDRTRHLIHRDALTKMKSTAILINVARGAVVNTKDLADALEQNVIAAAGLDVLEKEPMLPEDPLLRIQDSDRLIITPHMAWASTEARNRCVLEAYENISAFIKGEERCRVI